jgi:septum formation protein
MNKRFEEISRSFPLLLASSSPRRQELLRTMGIPFITCPADIPEEEEGTSPGELAIAIASKKALKAFGLRPGLWTLGADTVVVLANQVFGKPKSPEDALGILRRLSGKTHTVITAMVLLNPLGEPAYRGTVVTRVQFKRLSDQEILLYIHTGEPMDKAGAYGIQGLGAVFVTELRGSYSGVVGLPLYETSVLLKRLGYGIF